MKNKILLILMCGFLSACTTTTTIPVSMQTDKAEDFKGNVIVSPSGAGYHVVSEEGIACDGTFPKGANITKTFEVNCSDGRHGNISAKWEGPSATGSGKMDDGTRLGFAFGNLIQIANFHARQIMDECNKKRLNGKLKKWVQVSDCEDKIRLEYEAAGYPYMDLINLRFAKGRVIYEQLDAGKITSAEAKMDDAQVVAGINSEVMQRSNSQRATDAAVIGANAAVLNAINSMGPHTCNTLGNTTTCY